MMNLTARLSILHYSTRTSIFILLILGVLLAFTSQTALAQNPSRTTVKRVAVPAIKKAPQQFEQVEESKKAKRKRRKAEKKKKRNRNKGASVDIDRPNTTKRTQSGVVRPSTNNSKKATPPKPRPRPKPSPAPNPNPSADEPKIDILDNKFGNSIEAEARKHLGVKYVWGGNTPQQGFDCSGYTKYVFAKCNKNLHRVSRDQATQGTKVKPAKARKGDLIFFANKGEAISHVGIIISEKGQNLKMIHSTSDIGVTISDVSSSNYWSTRIKKITRL